MNNYVEFDEGVKQVIREICKLFMGKYIWKQIGFIFTHFGYDEKQQDEVKQRESNYVKEVLQTTEKEYQEIIKNQDENNKACDPKEKIVNYLECFYVNAKREKMEICSRYSSRNSKNGKISQNLSTYK